MKPKISIVVPVYNVECYIEKCIESILSQTFKEFEVILVNDGSTDKSGEICNKYKEKDRRVKVIHQKNKGQAMARNRAIKIAKGEYLGFVDSDDWIDINMYERLYYKCIEDELDLAVIGIREVDERNKCLNEYIPNNISLSEIIRRAYPCNKLFKKELFYKNNLFFKEGRYYEDLELIPKLFLKSHKVSYIEESSYNYLRRSNSTTNTRDERIIDNLLAYISLKEFMIGEGLYYKYNDEFNACIKYFKKYYLNMLYDYPSKFLIKNIKYIIIKFKELGENDLSPYIKLILKHINFIIKRKILFLIRKMIEVRYWKK